MLTTVPGIILLLGRRLAFGSLEVTRSLACNVNASGGEEGGPVSIVHSVEEGYRISPRERSELPVY